MCERLTHTGGATLRSPSLRPAVAVAALVLLAAGWFWFGVSFSATYPAWWNSQWVGLTIYSCAFALAAASLFLKGSAASLGAAITIFGQATLSFALQLVFLLPATS